MQLFNPVLPLVTLGLMLGWATIALPADDPAKRPEAQQEYWTRFERKDWSAAIDEARKLVEQARANAKEQPLVLARALTLLGNAQLSSGDDKPGAEASYREALEIIEVGAGGGGNPLIIDPLRGLGYTLALSDRHEEAISYLERALVLGRRSHGLFDMGQQGVLRQLADSLRQTGKVLEAEKHMLYLQRVGERAYGDRDPRMAPVLCVIGDWYVDTGNFPLGRDRYRDALRLVERKLGKDDPAVVEPLRSLARSYTQEIYFFSHGYQPLRERAPSFEPEPMEPKAINPKYLSSDGEKALERALAILDARLDTPPLELTDTLIQLGDWFQLKHQTEKALAYYGRAASLVGSLHPETAGAAPLSFPVRIYYPLPPLAMRNRQLSPDQIDEKFVTVEFTVTGTGDVKDAKVIEQNGTARQASETLQAIRAARYRPKFVNGEPVDTQGVINREVFKMRKQQPDEDDKES